MNEDRPSDPALHLYVDSADLDELRGVLPHPLIYGVTTNPTSMRRANASREDVAPFVRELVALGARAVHVQVESADSNGILADARAILAIPAGHVIPKIPATRNGFAAGHVLSTEGIRVTYTAVFEPEQALFAGMLGAAYVAPYLGRLIDLGVDGFAVIRKMQDLIERYGVNTRLLVASVRSRDDFRRLLDIGVGAITVPAALLPGLLDPPSTTDAERAFLADAGPER